jgi:hypothetical protein
MILCKNTQKQQQICLGQREKPAQDVRERIVLFCLEGSCIVSVRKMKEREEKTT